MCQRFYLFEPILTAILVSICSLIHLVRIRAIYDKSNQITGFLGALLLVQVVMMGVSCGFYHGMSACVLFRPPRVPHPLVVVPVPDPSQGCIAGPRHKFVGIYWVAPSLYFTVTFALALLRSFQSQSAAQKPLSLWKLMLRDGLNLYGVSLSVVVCMCRPDPLLQAIWIVNMVNMLFWFIVTPTDSSDTIRTIVTSYVLCSLTLLFWPLLNPSPLFARMAAVLTVTMTMRIILAIRGPLTSGGTFAGSAAAQTSSGSHSATRSHHTQPRTGPGAIGTTGTGPVFSINPGSQVGRSAPHTTHPFTTDASLAGPPDVYFGGDACKE